MTCAFCGSFKRFPPVLAAVLLLFLAVAPAQARSVYTPRDSGAEAPGGPRSPAGVPGGGSFGRTPEGGMGYVDAYGNPISSAVPEKKPHRRLSPGAYGQYGRKEDDRPLPDPAAEPARPAWRF